MGRRSVLPTRTLRFVSRRVNEVVQARFRLSVLLLAQRCGRSDSRAARRKRGADLSGDVPTERFLFGGGSCLGCEEEDCAGETPAATGERSELALSRAGWGRDALCRSCVRRTTRGRRKRFRRFHSVAS